MVVIIPFVDLILFLLINMTVNCNVLDEASDDYYSIIPQKLYDYDEIETIVMHNLIFKAIKFEEEICEFTFQNCLLDISNEKAVLELDNRKISAQCLPLHKSKYCLQKFIFKNSDCSFKLIHDKIKQYSNQLIKNLKACQNRYLLSDELKSYVTYSASSHSSSFFCFFKCMMYIVFFSLFASYIILII